MLIQEYIYRVRMHSLNREKKWVCGGWIKEGGRVIARGKKTTSRANASMLFTSPFKKGLFWKPVQNAKQNPLFVANIALKFFSKNYFILINLSFFPKFQFIRKTIIF